MITIEEAKETYFTKSTSEELKKYLTDIGVDIDSLGPRARSWESLRKRLMKTLGMNEPGTSAPPVNNTVKLHSSVVPPYNMKPTGVWEGRRHRLILNRPHGTKREAMKTFSVNGYVSEIRYGEPVSVPEPIWLLIRDTVVPVPKSIEIRDGVVLDRQTMTLDYVKAYSFQDEGVENADRCGSIIEWYQQQGFDFFKPLSIQELRRVAQELDIPWRDKDSKPIERSELLDRIYIHVFSDAPSTVVAA